MLKRLFAQRLHRCTGLAWLAVALLAVGGVTAAIDRLALQHLKTDAERTALAWAHQLAIAVPGADRVFAGEPATPQAIERLTALHGAGGLFRFKLYATDGRLRFISDQLASGVHTPYADHEESDHARGVARGERNIVELKHGDGVRRPETYSEVYVPVVKDARTIGVVEVYVDQAELAALTASSFRRAALTAGAVLALVIGVAAAATRWSHGRHRRTQDRVTYLARHDLLTGAINHAAFAEQLADACRAPAPSRIAVLCVDLDRFADVNDAHGHGVGDEVLRQAARRLHGLLRASDVLARIAGDRFALLQRDADDRADVAALAQRVIERLAAPHRLAGVGTDVVVGASVGAALHGADGDDADTLLHRAELALQQAKARGPARWAFYDATADRALHERRALVHDLRQALAEGSLQLHYQPLFDAAGGGLVGHEALARWPHPAHGFVPPAVFIALAEETGQIAVLGRFVLQRACAEAARWPAPLTVAVNLSPAQFHAGGDGIVAEVRRALAATGLAPQRLELEITESLLLGETEQVLATLRELKGLGVRIAMDDFGTGYSSLAYLWRFPFDKLKIDRAFTQGLGQDCKVDAIVRSIVTLAHTLGIRVNAEGVETAAQRDALVRIGCDELQGYLLGRPVPAERLVLRAVAVEKAAQERFDAVPEPA